MNTPKWVIGKGQCVYWKECNIIVVEKDSEGGNKETPLNQRNSQGMVPLGTELYLSSSRGKVKEK